MAARPPQFGAMRRAFNTVIDWVMGKQVVGKDAAGNVYYRWYEGSGPNRIERREVQWTTAYMYYDPNDLPSEWRMWLRRLREEPPTEEEMQQSAAKRAALQTRVAALEEKERLRRLRQQTVGTPDQHAGAQPDMARFLQQMGGAGGPAAAGGAGSGAEGGQAAAAGPAHGATGQGQGQGQGQGAESRPPGGDFKPETWRPGS